jgi:hypothetical protein
MPRSSVKSSIEIGTLQTPAAGSKSTSIRFRAIHSSEGFEAELKKNRHLGLFHEGNRYVLHPIVIGAGNIVDREKVVSGFHAIGRSHATAKFLGPITEIGDLVQHMKNQNPFPEKAVRGRAEVAEEKPLTAELVTQDLWHHVLKRFIESPRAMVAKQHAGYTDEMLKENLVKSWATSIRMRSEILPAEPVLNDKAGKFGLPATQVVPAFTAWRQQCGLNLILVKQGEGQDIAWRVENWQNFFVRYMKYYMKGIMLEGMVRRGVVGGEYWEEQTEESYEAEIHRRAEDRQEKRMEKAVAKLEEKKHQVAKRIRARSRSASVTSRGSSRRSARG